jgi:capsule biosynthesis phosphatase
MNYEKLVIVDFDDTLCLHPDHDKSDIKNGTPNVRLINKLNDLHDKGYLIHIYTARGHLSAANRQDADKKYRPVITDWLIRHGVKYDRLDFNKPYGIIYIDDKAVRPFELHLLEGL